MSDDDGCCLGELLGLAAGCGLPLLVLFCGALAAARWILGVLA